MQACSPDCVCNEDQPEEEDDDEPSKQLIPRHMFNVINKGPLKCVEV